jgi:hypothetical protein
VTSNSLAALGAKTLCCQPCVPFQLLDHDARAPALFRLLSAGLCRLGDHKLRPRQVGRAKNTPQGLDQKPSAKKKS